MRGYFYTWCGLFSFNLLFITVKIELTIITIDMLASVYIYIVIVYVKNLHVCLERQPLYYVFQCREICTAYSTAQQFRTGLSLEKEM